MTVHISQHRGMYVSGNFSCFVYRRIHTKANFSGSSQDSSSALSTQSSLECSFLPLLKHERPKFARSVQCRYIPYKFSYCTNNELNVGSPTFLVFVSKLSMVSALVSKQQFCHVLFCASLINQCFLQLNVIAINYVMFGIYRCNLLQNSLCLKCRNRRITAHLLSALSATKFLNFS